MRLAIHAIMVLLALGGLPGCAERGDPDELLLAAVLHGDETEVRRLLDRGANPNAVGEMSEVSVLALAAVDGHDRIVVALLDAGADVELGLVGKYTPLSFAAGAGHTDVVERLLEAGAAKDDGKPLMLAASGGTTATVRVLLDHGVNPDLRESDGSTALTAAAVDGQREVAEMLLAAGATPSLRDDAGKTAADYAREQGHDDLAAWLEEQAALTKDEAE